MLKEVIKKEREVSQMFEELKSTLRDNILSNPLPGVKTISESPRVCIVSLQALGRGKTIDPSYYLQPEQAEVVYKRLSSYATVTESCREVKEMVSTGKVGKTPLNPETIRILKESEFGKYAVGVEQ